MPSPSVPRHHPAMWVKGRPGDTRYICPFCDWFVDVGDGEVLIGYSAAVLRFGSWVFDRNEFVERMLEQHLASHADEMTESGK